jgi:hypothetical protein
VMAQNLRNARRLTVLGPAVAIGFGNKSMFIFSRRRDLGGYAPSLY